MLTEERKQEIARALDAYQAQHGLSQAKLAGVVGVSASYLSHISQANWNRVPAGAGKTTAISDGTWQTLARALGLAGTGTVVVRTANYTAIYSTLLAAKEAPDYTLIDGDTGAGKTFAVGQFQREEPDGTYVVKASATATASEFVRAMAAAVGATGLTSQSSRATVLRAVADRLTRAKNGLLVIDETEMLLRTPRALAYVKDLYDLVEGRASIVLVGANELLRQLRAKADRQSESYPQVVRRFGAEPVALGALTVEDAAAVYAAHGVVAPERRALQKDLREGRWPQVAHLCAWLRKEAARTARETLENALAA